MATNNEDIQWLYGKLKAKGYDIGTEQEFSSSLSNEEDRKWYYDKAKGMGLDIGSKADFDSLFTPQESAKEEVPQVNTALEGLPNGIAPMEQVPGLDGWKPQTKVPVQIPNTPEDNDTEGAPIANLDPMALATTFSEESRQMVGDTGRMLGAMTPDGRKKQRGLEIAGRMAGRNTRLPGLSVAMPTPEQPEASDGAQAAPKAQDMRGPQYYGTVVDQEDGQTKDQWLMPDGSLTSDFYEADVAAGEARSARLQREFEGRMAINGLDTSKPEDVAAQQAYDRLAQLEARAKMHSDEKFAKLEERYEEAGAMERGRLLIGQNGNTATSMVTMPASVYGNGIYDDEDKLIAAERKNLEDAITAHHAGKLKKTGFFFAAQNLVNAWEGVKDVFKDGDTYTAGMTSMHQSAQMLAIKAKLDKGEALTRGEESLLESMLVKQTIDENVEKPHGYTMGYTIANMVPFMIQMAMNPAAGAGGKLGNMAVKEFAKMMAKRAGQRAAKGFMMKAVARLGKKRAAAIAKGIGVTAGDIVASASLANTLQAPATMADAALRHAGDVAYDKDGTLHFEGGDGVIKAFSKAEGAMLIENYTEMLGAHFGVIGGAIGRGTGKAVRKLGGGKLLDNVMKLCANIRATDWAKGIAAIERRAQWNGSVGEVLEEEAGIVLNSIFTGDNSISDLWDKEQQIDIVLGVGAFGAFVSGIKTAGYPIARHKARKALDERVATCEASFGKNWDSIRETIDMADEADLAQTIAHLGRRYATTPEKAKALLEYASAMAKARAFNIASASAEEMQTNPEQRQIDQSYNNGYTAEGSGRVDVQNLYNARRERAINTLDADTMRNLDANPLATLSGMASAGTYTDEELSVAREYAAAKSAYDGMQQSVEDEIEAQIWRCNAAIDARTNRDTGMVQRATYGLENREIYIIKGNVVADENGVIDRSASDDTIAIVDLETGETKMVASKDLGQAEQPIAAEQFRSSMAAYVRQEIGDRARAQAEGRLLFEENEKCLILDDEGSQSEVTILGGATDEQGAPIADAVKVQYADGTTGVVAMSELQEQVNAAAAARMDYAEQELQQGAAARAAVDAEVDTDAEQDGLAVEEGGQRRSFALNDEVELIADQGGVTSGMITGEIDSDGLIEVQTDKPVNGQMVNRLTLDELMQLLTRHNGEIVDEAEVEGEPETNGSNESNSAEVDDGFIPIDTELIPTGGVDTAEEQPAADTTNEADVTDVSNVTDTAGQPAEATELERLPKNEKGEPIFEEAESPEAGWDALVEFSDGDVAAAKENADMMAEIKRKALEKVRKQKPKGDNPTAIRESQTAIAAALAKAEQEYDFWIKVASVEQGRKAEERRREDEAARARARERAEAEKAERGRGAEGDKPSLLDAVRTLFEKGKAAASKLFQMKFFDVAETPDFMKALGLTGDKFTIRYGVIARHIGKDAAHEIPEEIWAKLPEALKAPFAITKYYQDENKKVQKGYRLYTTLRLSSGAYVVVSAEVKNVGRELEVNAINTIFGREALSDVHDELIYKSDTITPEQQSLLNGNNPHQYPATRELSDGKVNNSASDKQGEDVKSSVQERLAAAEGEVNTEPSEAQKKAGNYKMGHVEIDGLQISIENPKGSMRRGKDSDGTPWETEMKNTYGYIKGPEGVDGDKIDVFLSDNPTDGDVYVVDQYNTDGTFDEHKVMYGFTSATEAEVAYLSNYSADWAKGRKVVVTGVTREEFKKWLDASDRKKKPFAEYKSVKPIEAQNGGAAEAAKLRQKSSRLEIEGAEKLSAERAEAVERYAEGHYCVPIRVIADEADIRESGLSDVAVAQMMAALTEEDVPAVYCREDKKIYIFAGHKDSNVGSTLAHENFHALTDAIGDARENRYMLDEYRYLLLADLDHGEDFSRIWKAVADAYPPHKRAEEFVAYTVGLMYVSEGAAKAIRRILDGNAKSSIFQQLINPILYGTQTKTDAYRSANPENRRGGGAGVQQGRAAGSAQTEGRADGGNSAGGEVADGKAGGAAEVAEPRQKENGAELNSQPDGGGDVRMSIGGSGEANAAVYQATKEMLESAGVKVHEIGSEEALAMLEKKNTPVAGLPNRANEKQPSGSVLAAHSGGSSSNATDSRKSEVKIDNNTRSAKNKIKKFKNGDFDGDYSTLYKALSSMGNLLSMRNRGGSRYTILRTDKGDTVAIRLSDHRANGNNFGRDVADRNLSIVIERKRYDVPDSEIEFTEAVIPLRVFEMHPKEVVSAIVNGVDDVLADKPFTLDGSLGTVIGHHGNDVRFHIRTYHGTGAEFDRFDFGYVGSGEGAQAFGWGGYVTEVKGIGKSYASAIGGKELLPKIEKVAGNIRQVRQWLSKNEEYNKYARNAGRHLRELQREYRAAEKEGNEKDLKFYGGLIELQEQSMKPENHASLIANKRRQIGDYQKELKDLEAQLAEKRHLYTVRIPDDTGDNYLDWDGGVTDSVRDKIVLQADAEGVSISFYGDEMAAGGYFAKMGENAAGFQLYGALVRSLGSDKAASGLLSRAGLTGIKYAADRNNGGRADGKKNYVVFKEDDMRITGHVRFLKGGAGTVYGWVAGGEVYLNRDVMNPETPVHEYTHLWDEMVRRENPELWARGVELMKQTPLWNEVLSDPNYADIRLDEDAVASEVHARLTGSDGAKLMEEMIVRAKKEGVFEIARAVSFVEELKRWLSDMFKSLKKTLDKWSKRDLRNLTVESFNRMTLRDLAEGKNPRSAIISRGAMERGLRLHAAMARGREAFDALRDRAVAERGIVMPGLNEKVVRVVEVPRHDFNGDKPIAAARRWAKESIVGEHTIIDSNGNEVPYTISGKSIDKYLSETAIGKSANIGVHLAALKMLPEIIRESVEVEIHPDYTKDNYASRSAENDINPDNLIHRFYGAALIDGQIHRVKATIIENGVVQKNKPHSYEVTAVELINNAESQPDNHGRIGRPRFSEEQHDVLTSASSRANILGIANILKGVEKSYDPGKKLLEESEKSELFRRGDERGSFVDYSKIKKSVSASSQGSVGRDRFGEKRQAELAARERERMAARIRELAERLHLDNVEVVTDASQLEGMRATAKGFFNKSTGKITIVLPNNLSTIDAEQTLLHEAVAHYGLRKLFGERFDTFLDNVYESATEEIRRKIAEMAARNGWNFRTATEEYLAGLAENTDFEAISRDAASQSWWAKVKQLFIDMVERIGFKGFRDKVGVALTDNELRYILWRSYANLAEPGATRSIFGEAADIAKQAELKVGNYAEGGIEAEYVEPEYVSAVNERFNEQLERWSSGVMRPEEVVQVGVPTGILSSLMPTVPILLRQKVLSKSRKKHGLSAAEMKNLPEALGRPIFVFKSSPETISVLTELKSADGNNLFVAIELGKDLELGGRAMIVNDILTIHGREIENVVLPILHNDSLVWADKKKGLEWLRSAKSNSQANTSQTLDDAAKKVKEFENPKLEEEELYRPGDFSPRDTAIARKEYERMVSSGGFQFQEAMQDSMLGLKKFYQAILGNDTQIEDVAGFENAYLFENRMSSMNAGEQHEYFRRFMEPLLKEIAKIAGANQRKRKELTDYLMAKHGLERNEHMRTEAAANGENADRDFAGLIGLTGEADWASAEATAKQWVDDYEKLYNTADLWKAINNATKATLEKVYISGIISKKTYEEVRDMYEYYIPLRGWNETTSDQVYGYLTSKDGPLGGSIIKKAEGRSSMADDPIATIAMMADDAIRQGNRNLMKQRFLNFVLNHPSDVASVHDIWLEYDDVADEWRPVFADVEATDTADEVAQKVEAFEQRMESLKAAHPDKYKKGREAQHIPYKVVKNNLREHQVLIKRNGQTFVVTINGNPRAAQALNGLTNPDVELNNAVGDLLKLATWANRQLSAFYTTRNPDFVVSNFMRDMLYANCMTWVKESPRYALRFHKNFGRVNPVRMRVLLGKWESGKLDMSDPIESMFYQFMINGGETGYTNVRDIEGHKRAVATELKKQSSVGRQAWAALGMQLDLLNRSVENCARFAAFVTSREFGRSIDRAIYDAKEVSVNFNKKGSGAKMAKAVGQTNLGKFAAYLGGSGRLVFIFWNAGIQGMANFGRQAKRHPAKFAAGATAMFTLGYIIPILAEMMGGGDGDDDDKNAYYNLPEYVRRSNICFRAGNQWISIPLPIEYRAMYGLGELAYGVTSGNERYSNKELAREIAAQVSQILPIDMLEGGGGWHAFIPSLFKPVTEAYLMNEGWTGLPIYRDNAFNKNDPEWTKAYASADNHLVDFTRWLNETTGGNDYKKGDIDINPAKLEYLLSGTFGGLFTFPNKGEKMRETMFGDREFEWRNMPIANRLIKSGDERTAYRKLQNEYYKYLEEYKETKRLYRKYEKADESGVLGYAERLDFLENSPEFLRAEIFDDFKDIIDANDNALNEETDKEIRAEIEAEQLADKRELVNALNDPAAYFRSLREAGMLSDDYTNYLERSFGMKLRIQGQ